MNSINYLMSAVNLKVKRLVRKMARLGPIPMLRD